MKEKLLQQVPLVDFFRERVQSALTNQQVAASEFTEFYLVNLLQEFRKSEKLFEQDGSKMQEKTLALLLSKAIHGDATTKIRCLKHLGDISLYTAGVFGESIKGKLVDIDYYIGMGGSAYSSLSDMLTHQKTFAGLYGELSKLFPNLVTVLSEVATTSGWASNQDLLRLYERWLATGNGHLEEMLHKAGILTTDKDPFEKPQ
ncbi:MAG: hypothetical protein A3F82_04545 [Deltaproteobacteria bacterium RIFCSPLOWO2_12_FULL_44_12]|nr:MAG: hypothetical protein A2712_07910 [Deltaproteobacteria bacterium RIFCSPHIGHO2_01_FULL_43_49]OGQ14735.1 MAG: hypothetical protein A3D22_09085 [Deltaproteobacteria bacterium RIFCSPHIGHO2_02_FULL_44_53]OGQ28121.1 MAG: hypothetical protein A3D98_07795 [Deltaproteobacteria bacterium RIFCSPHIGHO2_12_FULL_44_21]OGQ31333.1 MAG: hypothetical protein A2979_07845 [Deltaproteobacteria bacterium RIFCSPLOWO2_01_FULL_45_74]OGQ43325.1 MAG: hypothetical protein A3I70_01505 [Deltaproteobacteria bacterium 